MNIKLHNCYSFDYRELNIDLSLIQKLLGSEMGMGDEFFLDLIRTVHSEIGAHANLKAELKVHQDFHFNPDGLSLKTGGQELMPGKLIIRQLKDSEFIALVICTAGEGISRFTQKAMEENDSLKAYVIDLFGSVMVEAAMDLVQEDFKLKMEVSGFQITNRYSPGYCEWNVDQQHRMFSLFPGNYPGITLTESALMLPVKSVSCIIGAGKNVKFNPYTCQLCGMKNCIYRERKAGKESAFSG